MGVDNPCGRFRVAAKLLCGTHFLTVFGQCGATEWRRVCALTRTRMLNLIPETHWANVRVLRVLQPRQDSGDLAWALGLELLQLVAEDANTHWTYMRSVCML